MKLSQADTYYVLQAAVGHREDRNLPDYDIDLFAGGVALTPLSAALSNPVEGQWTDAVKIYQASPTDPLLGASLEIRLSSTDYETFFDDIRLIAVDSLLEIGATSDLNMDGAITIADWSLFIANSFADLRAYTPAQQFLHGDLDRDGDNDREDFLIFKSDYIAAHGEAAFNALLAVPEPAGLTMATVMLRKCADVPAEVLVAEEKNEPGGTRTHDPRIKSPLLYQLSYGLIAMLGAESRESRARNCLALDSRLLALGFLSRDDRSRTCTPEGTGT